MEIKAVHCVKYGHSYIPARFFLHIHTCVHDGILYVCLYAFMYVCIQDIYDLIFRMERNNNICQ